RKIERVIDFNFIYDLVKDKYSEDHGRPSIDPVVLIKNPVYSVSFWHTLNKEDNIRDKNKCGI
ncbi:hypothetical protein TheetDRAFT_3022, partial [Thermoanaerobacter ethanolicus JW 200]